MGAQWLRHHTANGKTQVQSLVRLLKSHILMIKKKKKKK